MSRVNRSDIAAYRRELKDAGLVLTYSGGHIKVRLPDGRYVGTVPASPSDPHWLENNQSYLRKRLAALDAGPTARNRDATVSDTPPQKGP